MLAVLVSEERMNTICSLFPFLIVWSRIPSDHARSTTTGKNRPKETKKIIRRRCVTFSKGDFLYLWRATLFASANGARSLAAQKRIQEDLHSP